MENSVFGLSWVLPCVLLCFSLRGFWPFLLPGFSLICTVLYHICMDMYHIYSNIRQCFFIIFSLQRRMCTECVLCCVHLWPHQVLRHFFSYFVDRASRYKFLVITNLTHFFLYLFISCLYMFRASQRWSSADRIVLIHHLVWLVCVSDCLVYRSGGNCRCINTIRSPDDERCDAQNT